VGGSGQRLRSAMGRTLGNGRDIKGALGRGTFGAVYKATDSQVSSTAIPQKGTDQALQPGQDVMHKASWKDQGEHHRDPPKDGPGFEAWCAPRMIALGPGERETEDALQHGEHRLAAHLDRCSRQGVMHQASWKDQGEPRLDPTERDGPGFAAGRAYE